MAGKGKIMAGVSKQASRELLERSPRSESFEAQEERIRSAGMKCAGSIESRVSGTAENVRSLVRARIARR